MEKLCKLCGLPFEPQSPAQKYCKRQHYKPCPVCGKPSKISIQEPNTVHGCSTSCTRELTRRTLIRKYGCDTTNPGAVPEVQAKMRKTCKERYGVENPMHNSQIRQKLIDTVKAKYGKQNVLQVPEIHDKMSQTLQERYGVPFYCMTQECREASGSTISKLNKAFSEMLKSLGVKHQLEFHIGRYSYDFYIPESQLLLEIDPTITHNSHVNIFSKDEPATLPNYHLDKTRVAEEAGYRCIHMFDWDDQFKLLALISQHDKTQVDVNTLHIDEVSREEADLFLNMYHLFGTCRGQKIRLGLYTEDEQLLCLMTFGTPKFKKQYTWELLRMCTDIEHSIPGGYQKLFDRFIHNEALQSGLPTENISVITYIDRSKFTGRTLEDELQFRCVGELQPAKIWSKDTKKITHNLLSQRGFDQLFKTHYGVGTNNTELMLNSGWLPIYDCGQSTYEWRYTEQ